MAASRSTAFSSLTTIIGTYAGLSKILVVLMMVLSLFACVPQGDYLRMEAECENQVKWEKKRCLDQSHRTQAEITSLKSALQTTESESRKTIQNCRKQLIQTQQSASDLEKTNSQLNKRLKELRDNLEKRQSIISLQNKVIRTLDDTKKTIETSLKNEISAQGIEVEDMEGRLKLKFVDKILFDSGKVNLNRGGRKLLLTFAESVRNEPLQLIQVRGYTDNQPIGPLLKRQFSSNWELSASRALAVVHFLQDKGRLAPERLSACALGSYRPIADNATESGRRQNRRIEIIIYPADSPFAVPESKETPKQ